MNALNYANINNIIKNTLKFIMITIVLSWFILFLFFGGLDAYFDQKLIVQLIIIIAMLMMISTVILSFLYPRTSFVVLTLIIIVLDSFNLVNVMVFNDHLTTYFMIICANIIVFSYGYEYMMNHNQNEFQGLSHSYQQLKRSHDITIAMMEITPKMLLNEDIDQILQRVLEIAIKLIPNAQSGSILIRNGEVMEFHAAFGYDLDILKSIQLRYQDTYQYRLGELFEPTIIKDVKTFNEANKDRNLLSEFTESKIEMAKAVLTCSIRLNNRIYGFINLDNTTDENAFTDEDKILTKHLASQIEIALNNHLLVEEIYKLSKYDALTGAYSRKYYQSFMSHLKIEKVKTFSLVVLDVNDLKEINDSFGHHVGDQYLLHFANLIKMELKKEDSLFRTGGDEFVIVMKETSLENARLMMQSIKSRAIKNPFVTVKDQRVIQFGCGLANYPSDSTSFDEVLQIADLNMYKNKELEKSKKQI